MKHTALITGASGGIGLELARVHAAKQRDMVIVARSETKLQQLKQTLEKEFGVTVRVYAGDLTAPGFVAQLVEWLKTEGIQVEILINNAGFGDFGLFHERPLDKTLGMMDLNMRVLTELSHGILPQMVESGRGRIMNVASTAAFFSGPLMSVYYATKNYVLAFSEGLANEVKDKGITVTAICPGATESGFQSAASMEGSKLVANKRLPTSAEVAVYGYERMEKGTVVAVHKFSNQFLVFLRRLLPRKFAAQLVRNSQERSH